MYCNFLPGRQFSYEDALTIMQDEEYLDDVDFDDIKRYDGFQKIDSFNANHKTFRIAQQIDRTPNENHHNPEKNYHIDGENIFQDKRKGKQLVQRYNHEIKNEQSFANSHQLLSRWKRGPGGKHRLYM